MKQRLWILVGLLVLTFLLFLRLPGYQLPSEDNASLDRILDEDISILEEAILQQQQQQQLQLQLQGGGKLLSPGGKSPGFGGGGGLVRVDDQRVAALESQLVALQTQLDQLQTKLQTIEDTAAVADRTTTTTTTTAARTTSASSPQMQTQTQTQTLANANDHLPASQLQTVNIPSRDQILILDFNDEQLSRTPVDSHVQCPPDSQWSPHCKSCMSIDKTNVNKLFYVHMPKAAGSAFTIPIRKFLDCDPIGMGCWGDPQVAVKGNVDCGGRLNGCYGINPLKQAHSVTMLREPISRLTAGFYDNKQHSGPSQYKEMASRASNVLEYSSVPGISNCQTKMVLGAGCFDDLRMQEEEAQKSLARLLQIEFFGIREYYNTSVCLFYKKYGGVPDELDFQVVRKSKKYDESKLVIDGDVLQQLRKSEWLDVHLYEKARDLFLQKVRDSGLTIVDRPT